MPPSPSSAVARPPRALRVLLTTPYDLAFPGGVNRHALGLLDALTAQGHTALLLGPASRPVFGDDPRIKRVGTVWTGGLNGAVSRITLDLRIGGAVRRISRAFAPDIVHVQEPFVPTLNTFALLSAGSARRVGTFHTYSERSRGYLWAWPWCNWAKGLLDAHVAVSPSAREFAAQFHPAAYRVIPNGIALPPGTQRRPAGPPQTPFRLLFVGRANERRKGFAVLREALRQLQAQAPGRFVLTVVGPDAPDVAGLPVTCHGQLDDAALSARYAAADAVVVPSIGGESFGLVALEALAHGVPVVASRIRGYGDWLAGRNVGELVPPADPAALAAALLALADDPARHAASAAGAPAVAAEYDVQRVCARLVEVYRGLA